MNQKYLFMKGWICAISILLLSVGVGLPQGPTQKPRSGNNQDRPPNPREHDPAINAAFNNLRRIEKNAQPHNDRILHEKIEPLYRKPSKDDLKNLMPASAVIARYQKFLQQPKTGIFKLNADSTCTENAQVVVATERCLSNNFPGFGTAYSFRTKSHRILHLADLVLENDVIRTGSLLQQGILVKLGNVELDDVSQQTAGLKYLLDFKPHTKTEELLEYEEKLAKGINSDGFVYSYALYVDDKATFALRSVAYRGKFERSISGYKYNEFDFDKRKDVLVVFRIVEKDANGDLTILWKEISEKDSPVMKIEQKKK